jgi:hypothetical protein
MKGPLLALCAVLIAAGLATAPAPRAQAAGPQLCAFPSPPRVLVQQGASHPAGPRLVQVWDAPNADVYGSQAEPAAPAWADFKAGVARRVSVTDPVELLRASPAWNNPRLKRNNALLAERHAEWIRPAGCLEKLLQSFQHARVDTFQRPTEFAALVLRSPDGARLRIYYLTIDQDGIGRVSPITEPAAADVRQGWRLAIALHNHNFHPGQPSLDGVLAPSEADAELAANLAAELGLEAAWITNGLHTSRIPAAAFGLFVP